MKLDSHQRDVTLYHAGLRYRYGSEAEFVNPLMQVGNTDAQYNAARVLRHLAMSGGSVAKSSSLPAVPALLSGLKVLPVDLSVDHQAKPAGLRHFQNGMQC